MRGGGGGSGEQGGGGRKEKDGARAENLRADGLGKCDGLTDGSPDAACAEAKARFPNHQGVTIQIAGPQWRERNSWHNCQEDPGDNAIVE